MTFSAKPEEADLPTYKPLKPRTMASSDQKPRSKIYDY